MRITCGNIEELICCLTDLLGRGGSVYEGVVYYSVSGLVDGTTPQTSVRKRIAVLFSLVAITKDGAQYIMEAAQETGFDYTDATEEKTGTLEAERLKQKVNDFCSQHGLRTLPGMVDY